MSYLFAPLALAAACVAWFLLQRWLGTIDSPPCGEPEPECQSCAFWGRGCRSPAVPAGRGSLHNATGSDPRGDR